MTSRLLRDLKRIEPSEFVPGVRLYPCSALLDSGGSLECVYFVAAQASIRLFGREYREGVSGSAFISVNDVDSISESPARLPAKFASRIYEGGESRHGAYSFKLVFSRWCQPAYLVGGFVDFLRFPGRYGPSDIQDVLLHRGANRPSDIPPFKWCVYE